MTGEYAATEPFFLPLPAENKNVDISQRRTV